MSEPQVTSGNRRSVLSLAVSSKSVLYAAYMPFLKGGGIFLPTNRVYKIGDEVFLLLQLMDDPAKLPIQGTVAWVTPPDAQGGKQQGIGLRFGEDDSSKAARAKIESVIGTHLASSRQTHTL
ncbi:PilZ domain-containing protein [Methyloversatilis sp.]|uniref:PilZ domain-containing protein n=1 Tax=Methyloversatilis sp. TaxID=2569862 RepID=UPI0027331E95|nr:PilZ domain-containing protein [Methyloversatilis sp.]MDP2868462.1 PilZ domain-containing protein [Methyloversatilis sp.]MDP3287250.1 PilZ domain-containing protein [Methyloversatilis sp.]MDP3454665.1 PilZ domain-containing protein [Methyloversatilis sp.]MDP3579273.1 PilZ domain-containing protein [Methyloversatilis sp.]